MARIFDVAEFILSKTGKISTWKLQKLVYYSQAWHLVWDEEPLFEAEIQAWANGPVCPDLYQRHRGSFNISTVKGKPTGLTDDERESVEAIVKYYGEYTGQQLSDFTHSEPPWKDAREGLSPKTKR